ncbi:MAG: fasciclin domain-containing protein [Chloroflexota bacterium]
MRKLPFLSILIILALGLAACVPAAPPSEAPAEEMAEPTEAPEEEAPEEEAMEEEMMADIVDTAVAAGSFGTLVAAVEAAGLVDTLKGEGPFTVFAPTDDAFAALPEGTVETLLEDPTGDLTNILLYHVVSGKVMAADVVGMDGAMVETVGGSSFTITVDGDSVMVDGANVVTTDIETSNGVIHVIDAVIIPAADEEEAMEEEAGEEEAAEEEAMEEDMMADIVDTAVGAGSFGTLVAAVEAAGLVDTLKGEGPFTVFAPTDDAFAALPEGTVETLLEDPTGDLTNILLYHVVSGKVMAADVVGMDGAMVETVGGSSFTITVDGDSVMVDGANVVTTDIETSNGVIHVIDAVIIPAE